MSVNINISGTIIEFPTSGDPADWAPALTQFAQVVADNINAVINQADILPNFFTIDAFNPGTNVLIPGFTFDTNIVRSAEIAYAVIRQRDSTTLTEEGTIHAVYNPDGASGFKWEVSNDYTGEAQIALTLDDNGQVRVSTEVITGIGSHTGRLSYSAKTVLNS